MDKKNFTSLTTVIVSGLLAVQSLSASAQVQVQVDSAAQTQPEAPPVQPPVQPPASVEVNVAAPAPPVVVNSLSVGERYGGGSHAGGRLMIAGGAMFGVTYFGTVLGAAIASDLCQGDSSLGCREANWPIYLPIIGPFIQMGYLSGSGSNTGRALLAIDGAVQAGGLAMFIAGAVLWGSNATHHQYAQRVHVVPYSAATGTGLLAFGHF